MENLERRPMLLFLGQACTWGHGGTQGYSTSTNLPTICRWFTVPEMWDFRQYRNVWDQSLGHPKAHETGSFQHPYFRSRYCLKGMSMFQSVWFTGMCSEIWISGQELRMWCRNDPIFRPTTIHLQYIEICWKQSVKHPQARSYLGGFTADVSRKHPTESSYPTPCMLGLGFWVFHVFP
jgi:hypothetical protein